MEDLTALTADWLTTYDSSTDALLRTGVFASPHELDVAIAVRGGVDVLASHDHRLRRGLRAARTRARGTFGEWTGGVGALPAVVRTEIDQRHSASALQEWATCPTRHLFQYVLGIRDVEDVGARDGVDPRERGTLVHAVLEQFLSDHLGDTERPGRDPGEAWSDADLDDLLRIFEDRVAGFVAEGLAGRHAAVWSVERSRLRRALTAALQADSESRRRNGSWPIALEMPFGRDGHPDLEVYLPTQGPVTFAGFVDRVDATIDGGLVVLDYKAGKAAKYADLPVRGSGEAAPDVVDRGRMLQLPLYALASRARFGSDRTPVEGYFSLVERGGVEVGSAIDDAAVERLTDALEVSVSGIRLGIFPANPGKPDDSRGWDACRYCAFDRVCPDTRGEQWRAARESPAVAEYRRLVGTEEEA
nr:PD-(D/E)XK nuclease family protein [Kineococcus siccus]